MPDFPEKSKRKGKPLTANEKQTLRLLIVLTVTASLILLSIFSVHFSSRRDNPFEMTSTAIHLTNDPLVFFMTYTDVPLNTQTADAAQR
jgi:hypothetical protein